MDESAFMRGRADHMILRGTRGTKNEDKADDWR